MTFNLHVQARRRCGDVKCARVPPLSTRAAPPGPAGHTLRGCAARRGGNGLGPEHHAREEPTGRRLFSLSLLALGIVYGDIGTSPLYAMRECFYGAHPVALNQGNVLGVLSL